MQASSPFSLTIFLEAFNGAPGAFVLDLGCGTGRHAQTLRGAGFRVWALDVDLDAVETAQALLSPSSGSVAGELFWIVGNGSHLPFPGSAFDGVVCIDVLHWAQDEASFHAMWDEAWRVLRPGGTFYVRLRILEADLREDADDRTTPDPWTRLSPDALKARVAKDGGEWVQPISKTGDTAVFQVRKPG